MRREISFMSVWIFIGSTEVAALLLAGLTVHHVRDQSFFFILSEHNHPRTTEAQLLPSYPTS